MAEISQPQPLGVRDTARRTQIASLPGLWPGILVVILCGVVSWFWALPRLTGNDLPFSPGDAGALTEVAPQDIEAALASVAGNSSFVALFQKQTRSCGQRLAWVTVARPPGEPPARLRLRSGTYFSPDFILADKAMRVALPFPGPYTAGRGVLSVLDEGAVLTVALTPAWHVSAKTEDKTRTVTWTPDASCSRGNG